MIKVEVDWCDGVAPFCFVTTVELTAIAKSCVEQEKSLGKIAQGTNCPYEEIFPKLRKNCCDHTWLVPLAGL